MVIFLFLFIFDIKWWYFFYSIIVEVIVKIIHRINSWFKLTVSCTVSSLIHSIIFGQSFNIVNGFICILVDLTLPPVSAVNRGIGVQGVMSILAGLLGIGSGVQTSSENVGNIGITRVSIYEYISKTEFRNKCSIKKIAKKNFLI